jgi:outer membrane protein assembly factor BamB
VINLGRRSEVRLVVQFVAWMLLSLMLSGCNSSPPALPPTPLESIKPELRIERLWQAKVGNGHAGLQLKLQPAILGDHLFAVARNGTLLKLDRHNGKTLWQRSLPHEISAGVAAKDDLLMLATANGRVLALAAADGAALWETQVSAQALSVPVFTHQLALVQTVDGRLYALDRATGAIRWVHDTVIPVLTLRGSSTPRIATKTLLAGFANGRLVALDAENGFVHWEHPISESTGRSELERLNDLTGEFAVHQNRVYVANYHGNLMAIDIPTGRVIWVQPISSHKGLDADPTRVFVVDSESAIHALDARVGKLLWEQRAFRGRDLSAPMVAGDHVVVGDYEGFVHWLARNDGRELARVRPDRFGVASPMQWHDDILYIQGNQGNLAAYQVRQP